VEERASNWSGSSNSKLVQTLQEAIAKAQDVDMAAITEVLKAPNFDLANKDDLLEEASTIQGKAHAILKTSSPLTVKGVPNWIKNMQMVLNATSILAEKVYAEPFFEKVGAILVFLIFMPLLYAYLIGLSCCDGDFNLHGCNFGCVVLIIVAMLAIIVAAIVFLVGYIIMVIVSYIGILIPDQRMSTRAVWWHLL